MSYAALGQATPADCSQYIVTGDGRCADSSGVHPLSWFHLGTGKCVSPPPVACDVDGSNLPADCPAGQRLFSGSPTGCAPIPATSTPPVTIPPATTTAAPPAQAGIGGWPIVLIGAAVGVGLVSLLSAR